MTTHTPPGAASTAKSTSASDSPAGGGAEVDGVDVDAVSAAVAGCPGVSGLYAGRLGEIGTYLPGRRVAGVQVDTDTVTVQVRTHWDVAVSEVSGQIRSALAGLTDGRSVDIVIADVDDPPDETRPVPVTAQVGPATVSQPASPLPPMAPLPGSATEPPATPSSSMANPALATPVVPLPPR